MDTTKDNYLQDLFINEAKPALDRHSGSGGDKPSQTKIVEITENGTVVVNPDSGYVMSKVTANVNVEKGITPTGTKDITENGEHNVTEFETVNVNVASSGGGDSQLKGLIEGTTTEISDDTVETVKQYAFYQSTVLASVSFPNLKSIGSGAFYNCTNLALTELPSGLTSIGSSAFNGCTNLALTELPSGLHIGLSAFRACTRLTSITFKGKPRQNVIPTSAFQNCSNLKTINVPWAEGEVANAPWGATNATINYNYAGG